ncbi:MAG: flippase-like domain-containing protein [Prevotella sp.]|nr:flippase-like domain-containing protein [Prevotella sp.]
MENEQTKNVKNHAKDILHIVLSLLLCSAILYWMYRGFDFERVRNVLFHEMNWTWMLLSFPFGILAQAFRGWRWRQTLEPLGEHSRTSTRVYSIFLSYAASLLVPRIGEFARCGVLNRYDGVSFPKALGTVVSERVVDSLLVLLMAGLTFLWQIPVFMRFFDETGTSLDSIFHRFTTAGWIVTAVCGLAALVLIWLLLRKLSIYNKVKETLHSVWLGIASLRKVKNHMRFILFTLAIWLCYFLHYYLTFFCFDATAGLGVSCALVTFIVGSIAVIVPTPNGAGPWHFAVKTMLVLYGVHETDALYFVLIVHSVQTLLVLALGVFAWLGLSLKPKQVKQKQ